MNLVLTYAARSDRGLVRTNNEDSFYAGARLLALADGMGGHAAGEVASGLMIDALSSLDDDEPGGNLLGKLETSMQLGNEAIADQVDEDPSLDGMGTTLTAILFDSGRIGLVHVGDSRAYLHRDGALTQITRDDTFVQSLVDEGRITAEQAHTHPQRSLIMKALAGNEVEPTLTLREARAGDRYLLCSDGLSDVVSDQTISETLASLTDDGAAADRLIELALRSGGPDNVTVVLATVENRGYGESRPIVGGAASDNDEDYEPPANTAAARAAALRPPRDAPKRVAAAPDRPAKRRRRPWLWIAVAVVLIAAAIGALLVRQAVRSNYFLQAASDGSLAISRGVDVTLFGNTFATVVKQICVTRDASPSDPSRNLKVELHDVGAPCQALTLSDLSDAGRSLFSGLSQTLSLTEAEENAFNLGRPNYSTQFCEVTTRTVVPPTARPGVPPASAGETGSNGGSNNTASPLPTSPLPTSGAPAPAAPPGQPREPRPTPSTTVVTQTSTPEKPCRTDS